MSTYFYRWWWRADRFLSAVAVAVAAPVVAAELNESVAVDTGAEVAVAAGVRITVAPAVFGGGDSGITWQKPPLSAGTPLGITHRRPGSQVGALRINPPHAWPKETCWAFAKAAKARNDATIMNSARDIWD